MKLNSQTIKQRRRWAHGFPDRVGPRYFWLLTAIAIPIAISPIGCTSQETSTTATTTVPTTSVHDEPTQNTPTPPTEEEYMGEKITKTDDEWRDQLTAEQYYVTRQKGTERAGTGDYAYNKDDGTYRCVCCGLKLFSSANKYESGTGWPSFDAPIADHHVSEIEDRGFFSVRTEVVCARCDAHLGHVFNDGPHETTGLRYCMNSAALSFDAAKETGGDEQADD